MDGQTAMSLEFLEKSEIFIFLPRKPKRTINFRTSNEKVRRQAKCTSKKAFYISQRNESKNSERDYTENEQGDFRLTYSHPISYH